MEWYEEHLDSLSFIAVIFLFVGMAIMSYFRPPQEDIWQCVEWKNETFVKSITMHSEEFEDFTMLPHDQAKIVLIDKNETIFIAIPNFETKEVCIKEGKNGKEEVCIDKETGKELSCKEACGYYFKNCEEVK